VDPAPRIVKVGGSLLPGRDGYARVAAELAKVLDQGPCWVVVSAAKGVTDALQSASGLPGDEGILTLHERLFAGPLPAHLMAWWRTARAAAAAGRTEALMAWGEQASAELLRIRLSDLGHDLPVVELAPERAPPALPRAIVPGFYLRQPDGAIRLLPRGGSDISAVLAAKWAGAREVSLWKEGGGIRLQPGITVDRVDATTLLAWLGERVRPVHPEAVRLAASAGIALALEDPWGQDGATRIVPTAGPIPSRSVPERVAGEAAP
jgi:aspartokinase